VDPVLAWRDAFDRVCALVERLDDAELDARVPACPDWTARDLLAHMVGLGVDVLAGDEPDDHNSGWTQRQVDARRGRSAADLLAEWRDAADDLTGWMREHGSRPLNDVVIHEQDLRGAVGTAGGRDSAGLRIVRDRMAARFASRLDALPPIAQAVEIPAGQSVIFLSGAGPQLLEALTKEFITHKFDRKHLIRTILNSRTYQANSRPNKFNETDTKFFSHARQQLLTAEQLLDAVCLVTEAPEAFGSLPMGTMVTQLPAPPKSVATEFLVAFGQPNRQSSCACERQSAPGLTQTLQLFNGTIISNKVNAASKRIQTLIDNKKSNDEIVTELYLASLCRKPRDNELKVAREYVETHEDRLAALQDVTWSLLNTREFLYRR